MLFVCVLEACIVACMLQPLDEHSARKRARNNTKQHNIIYHTTNQHSSTQRNSTTFFNNASGKFPLIDARRAP